MPQRIQRKRTRGWRMPEGAVYVGRPSRWGNPYRVGDRYMWLPSVDLPYPFPGGKRAAEYDGRIKVEECPDAATAVRWFEAWLTFEDRSFEDYDVGPLIGKDLACWCPLFTPCHADVLLRIANGGTP